jgi:hypothetical protein
MSLEVAEHLRAAYAPGFIKRLCSLGDVILFSASIPGQGGLNHVNEQYPGYWANLFQQNGFLSFDCIRQKIWTNTNIDRCYRQNIMFYVKADKTENNPAIIAAPATISDIVHPEYLADKDETIAYYKRVLKNPFRIIGYYFQALSRRIKRLLK